MRKSTLIRWGIIVSIALIPVSGIFAGTTGKIAGTVIDAETQNPLPGVNVIVEGTDFGAATDENGRYFIINVPPGTYSVKTMMIGYADMIKTNVRVMIDLTTEVNFQLSVEAIGGEEITVVAERSVVQEDLATSVAAMSGDEVERMPLTSVDEVVGLQAGVESGVEIRGGASEEALFLMDGVTMRDPRNNAPITGIALSSIQEISVERGGFSAEYGQVRSGIVNVVTKQGSKQGYHGALTVKYSPPQKKHFGVSPFSTNSMWMRPYLDDEVAWSGTQNGAWDRYTQRQYPRFDGWNTIAERLATNDDPSDDLTPLGAQQVFLWEHRRQPITNKPDYNIDAGFGGPVPFVSAPLGDLRFYASYRQEREMLLIPLSREDYRDYDWNLRLTSDLADNMKLNIAGLLGRSYNVAINATDNTFNGETFGITGTNYWNPTDYVRTPEEIARVTAEQRPGRIFSDSWYSEAVVGHLALSGKFTHNLSKRTLYEISLEHIQRDYTTGPVERRSSEYVAEVPEGSGHFVTEAPYGWSPEPNSGITGMFFGGHTATARDSSYLTSTRLKFDLISQINFHNQIKAGAEVYYSDLHLDYGSINSFFGDVNWVDRHESPIRGALYIQDKLEAKGFIMNLGLRMDISDPNTRWIDVDPFNREYFSSSYSSDQEYPREEVSPDVALSPRLSISHPITENSKLFFNYGHFKQLPTYEQMFRVGRGVTGKLLNIGDPTLESARTVQYELGFDQVLYESILLQIAGFYKDISNQQSFTNYNSRDGSVNYQKANNLSYEDIRGFELTLKKNSGRWLTGFANYTYQVNTYGFFGSRLVSESPIEQREYDLRTENFYQTRPTPQPYARAYLSLHSPDDFGPAFAGLHPLAGWGLNLIGEWRAGEWITWNPLDRPAISQNLQVRDYADLSLKVDKQFFTRSRTRITLFMEVDNILNLKLLSGASFYDNNDYIFYMESLHLPESRAYTNIPGDDRPGDYRKAGVEYQPIERYSLLEDINEEDINSRVIYYTSESQEYWEYANGQWQEVGQSRMDQILEDKAYIDMPNQTSFNFLNPRRWFFGIKLSVGLN